MAETFQVTARKWRPMRFDEVVGQDHVTRTLKNAIESGRLAHAYLFTGQRGCGKTTVARLLAKAINCPNAPQNGFEPCNHCPICLSITDGSSMDVREIDGASNNGVDDVRSLRDNVKYPPVQGSHKVIIIDEVHMLSTSAFNALLKTLEEPPKHLVFIFATTEVQKVLPTILSRTQRYDFRRMQLDEITKSLRHISEVDGITIEDDALLIIAKKGDGSMRDAQSIFDQVVAYCGKKVETEHVRESLNLIDTDFFFSVTDAIKARAAASAFELGYQIISKGYDIEEFFNGLLEHFRNILTVIVTQSPKLVEAARAHQERYVAIAKELTEGDVIRLIRLAQSALERLKNSQQPRITLEVALVEMMMMNRAVELQSLITSIDAMKNGGGFQAAPEQGTRPVASPRTESTRAEAQPAAPRAEAAHITPEPTQMTSAPRAGTPLSIADPVAAGGSLLTSNDQVTSLEFETVRDQWDNFVESVRSKRSLFSIMPEVELCGVRRNLVYLSSSDQHTLDVLGKFKEMLVEALRSFFSSTTLTCEFGDRDTMHSRSGMPLLAKESAPNTVAKAAPKKDRAEIEDALIALGAQEV
jgi:DNA polymerase-3 subunit gamma/tau